MKLYDTGVLVSEVAGLLGAVWEGDGSIEINGAAALESAEPSHISFVANRKAIAAAEASKAGCLIVPKEFPAGRTLIRSADPRAAFARVVAALYPKPEIVPGAHPTAVLALDAVVDPSASIGPHATIGTGSHIGPATSVFAGCSIGARVSIGANCTLYPNVTIYDDVTVGDRAVLHSGCVLGADGFGFVFEEGHYEKFPQIGRVEIGNDVEIGANSCVDRAALGVTSIGHGTKLDNMVHVGHNCRIGRHVVVAAQTGFSGGVVVEDYAVIGGQVGIGDKARIESGAVLGSGCGILTSKIVRKGQVVWGTPARPLKEYLEQLAHLSRLPELRKQIAAIEEQLRELRAALE
jgi:UDP-3-O-[3-hydroxymyristoyl] glucosamine N-acyltransferase